MSESGGPSRRRMTDVGQQLEGDACREAISFLVHAADEAEVMQKMKQTFKHRQELVHNPERSADVLNIFRRFLDVEGLINQDFALLFNSETSNKLLERGETAFKQKIINEGQSLTSTAEIQSLISAAEGQGPENGWPDLRGYLSNFLWFLAILNAKCLFSFFYSKFLDWDSDMSSVLLLLHLLPPPPGKKKTKISSTEAVERLVNFHKFFICVLINIEGERVGI
ncbi:uncharacterized protein LOC117597934 [Pangasianodon hypophthalmus]|uniref:uncharacterized protein LOC117597934 n=1 Tax=Pangasianodon hypophthalmus TaxID=310915 RepID=UPI00230743E5|nr:uncharacterized protein LOC117597934 [Pangasianodon hypophthalmus]